MTASLIGALLLFGFAAGVMIPAVAWLDRRQRAGVTGERSEPHPDGLGEALDALLAPARDAFTWITHGERDVPGAAPVGSRLAPLIGWLSAWAVLAVVPFGGRYEIVGEPTTLALTDPGWGLLAVVLFPAIAVLGNALSGVAGSGARSLLGGVRAATQGMAALLALCASLLPMLVLYATLQPTAVGMWQDAVIPFEGLATGLGVAAPAWLPAAAGLPAWGVVLNPLAFVLFVVSSMMVVARPPFDAPFGRDLDGGVASELAGARRAIAAASGHLWTGVFACLIVLLFLGGGSIPWLVQSTLVGFVEPLLGVGFANAVCAVGHFTSFVAKVALVVYALLWLRWALPTMRDDQVRSLCLRGIVPLALLDALATAAVLAAWEGIAS